MRYPDSGGLTAAERARRAGIRQSRDYSASLNCPASARPAPRHAATHHSSYTLVCRDTPVTADIPMFSRKSDISDGATPDVNHHERDH